MAGLFYNYEKAGPGVAKDAPKKKRPLLFLSIAWRKLGRLMGLNLLYTICCIPIFLIGPATAGLVKVLRCYSVERHSYAIHDFFKSYKQNFKYSLVIGLFDLLFAVCAYCGYVVYPALADRYDTVLLYIPYILMLSVTFTIVIMSFYAYLMIVTTDISLKNIIKNSFYLTCAALKTNILTLLIVAAILLAFGALLYYNFLAIFLVPFMPVTLIWLLICFNCYPVIEKYVINPYYEARGEVNPEYKFTAPDNTTVFTDKGGTEAPIMPKSSKKKGGKGGGRVIK